MELKKNGAIWVVGCSTRYICQLVCIYVTLVSPRITPKLIRHKRLSVFVRCRADSKLDS